MALACRHVQKNTTRTIRRHFKRLTIALSTGAFALISDSAVSLAAGGNGNDPSPPSISFTETPLLEWTLPADTDFTAGAITRDTYPAGGPNRLLFVTRNGDARLFLFQVPKNAKYGLASWTSHRLDPSFLGPTGGLKRLRASHDRRFVFVKTLLAVQKVDTYTNTVTPYPDTISFVSDIAVDNRYNVFSSAEDFDGTGFLQRLDASVHGCIGAACPAANVTRWELGGIVGCVAASSTYTPCLLGVAVHPKSQHLVYVAEGQYITEVDTNSKSCTSCPNPLSKVRRWDLEIVGGPGTRARQIQFDSDGLLWVNTNNDTNTNALLVSLDTKPSTNNRMTSHRIPDGGVPEGGTPKDSFGIDPDGGRIGHTANDFFTEHAVSMLTPNLKTTARPVTPVTAWVARTTDTIQPPTCDPTVRESGTVPPVRKTVTTRITAKADGTFVEAFINQETNGMLDDSTFPLGITADMDRAVGSFFYTVGEAPFGNQVVTRVGLARLPHKNLKGTKDRDDEDCDDDGIKRGDDTDDDDDGMNNTVDNDDDNDEIPDWLDDDDDCDGIKNEHDRKDSKESQERHSTELASSTSQDFPMTAASNTLAFIATAASTDLLSTVSIEIRNASGVVVASAPPVAGVALVTTLLPAAGDYIVRVKNHSLTPAEINTTLITRNPF